MMTNKQMAHEIMSWLISYAELAAGMREEFGKLNYQSKVQACVQIAETCGLIDHEDAKVLYVRAWELPNDDIYEMFEGLK